MGPGTADVLGCRRKDVRERYKEPAGRAYGLVRPEQASRLVIREVCKNPGYNREDVVTWNYMD
ncbi:hypothetical protein [Desulfotomaculum copahuensis]|uniref:Uncharacterized protein n=1 Tax=Desulfotomaculum copahuensis TaxID=1838280 RepID=A0A1B7LAY8_9FIRM|nr:hypothetical protein [Desulfotomaculum copahuensis]OAT79483.1 hypothetical protein A6M21_15745 [Desulfotomaculum copahuensis]